MEQNLKEAELYQKEYRKNHTLNIIKIKKILDIISSWLLDQLNPQIGEQGNRNHLQCSSNMLKFQETREHYIPLMKQAVLDKKFYYFEGFWFDATR